MNEGTSGSRGIGRANEGDPDDLSASDKTRPVDWVCAEDPGHRWETTVKNRCLRLTGCPECQRLRGIAAEVKGRSARERLQAMRDAWGGYDEQPAPVAVSALADDEDF